MSPLMEGRAFNAMIEGPAPHNQRPPGGSEIVDNLQGSWFRRRQQIVSTCRRLNCCWSILPSIRLCNRQTTERICTR